MDQMKKFFTLLLWILAVASVARSQQKDCNECTPAQRGQREQAAAAKRRLEIKEMERPRNPALSKLPLRPQYTKFQAKFPIINQTDKKIEEVTWECKLVSAETRDIVSANTLLTHKNIAPHKSAVLSAKIMVPLRSFYGPKVIPVGQITQVKPGLPDAIRLEQVNTIKEIKYSDGSVHRP
jgi:hypothetical protein